MIKLFPNFSSRKILKQNRDFFAHHRYYVVVVVVKSYWSVSSYREATVKKVAHPWDVDLSLERINRMTRIRFRFRRSERRFRCCTDWTNLPPSDHRLTANDVLDWLFVCEEVESLQTEGAEAEEGAGVAECRGKEVVTQLSRMPVRLRFLHFDGCCNVECYLPTVSSRP